MTKKMPMLKGKPKYADRPRYPMIYDYEGEVKKNYKKMIKVMSMEIAYAMTKFVKDEK